MVSERIRPLNPAGFGLAELAVTLAVVAVVTAFAAPSLVAAWRAATLRAAAEELVTALNFGRQLAISRNTVDGVTKTIRSAPAQSPNSDVTCTDSGNLTPGR